MSENISFKTAFKDLLSSSTKVSKEEYSVIEKNVTEDGYEEQSIPEQNVAEEKVVDLFEQFKIELKKTVEKSTNKEPSIQKPENQNAFSAMQMVDSKQKNEEKQKDEKSVKSEEFEKKINIDKDETEDLVQLKLLNNKYWENVDDNKEESIQAKRNNKKNKKKKYKKISYLEVKEEELDIKNIFTTQKVFKNVHSSGERYAADETHFLDAERKLREEAQKKIRLRVPASRQVAFLDPPPPSVPDIHTPTATAPPPSPIITADEEPWDAEWVPWNQKQ